MYWQHILCGKLRITPNSLKPIKLILNGDYDDDDSDENLFDTVSTLRTSKKSPLL